MEKPTSKINESSSFTEKIKILPKNIKEVLFFLISEKIINPNKIKLSGDLEGNVKQVIEDSIKEKYLDINERFSELRKSGKDLGVLNFKLMLIPLKIKIFLSTYEKKDIEILLMRIKDIEKEISSTKS
jgi:hypothetical protein